MSKSYEYMSDFENSIEWNDPFTGYDYDDLLLTRLRQEYENDAFHDQRKTGLQEGTQLGTHQEEEPGQGPRTTQRSSLNGG